MKILIVKHGGLGDVVRTSYFIGPLRRKHGQGLRLFWLTAPEAVPLIARNSYIDRIVTRFAEVLTEIFDIVYSLDDEDEVLQGVSRLRAGRTIGLYLKDERVSYSAESAAWCDMGLRSCFGKARADKLKKRNMRGHAEIFSEIFGVTAADPCFYGDARLEAHYGEWLGDKHPTVGINAFAGGRWPAKELLAAELEALIGALLCPRSLPTLSGSIVLLGAGPDRDKNLALAQAFSDPRVRVADTDGSPLHLAALIRHLDFMVSSDSLAMHLAIAQGVPTVAFFTPTSAVEIDDFGRVTKVVSSASDYCSYRKDADNSTITHTRLLKALTALADGRLRPHARETYQVRCR